MKVSGLANEVIAAPANAEQRLLKVCASVAEKKNVLYFHITSNAFNADSKDETAFWNVFLSDLSCKIVQAAKQICVYFLHQYPEAEF